VYHIWSPGDSATWVSFSHLIAFGRTAGCGAKQKILAGANPVLSLMKGELPQAGELAYDIKNIEKI
jgi:hypothetical protein